MFQKKYSAAK